MQCVTSCKCKSGKKSGKCVWSCSHWHNFVQMWYEITIRMWFQSFCKNRILCGLWLSKLQMNAIQFQSGWTENVILAGSLNITRMHAQSTLYPTSLQISSEPPPFCCTDQQVGKFYNHLGGNMLRPRAAWKESKSWEPPLKMKQSLHGSEGKLVWDSFSPSWRLSLLHDAVRSLHILISHSDSRRLCARAAGELSFQGLLNSSFFITFYIFFLFSSAHKPQVWEGRFLWKAGETWRGLLCYSL